MSQIVTLTLNGATASTTVSDPDAAKLIDALRHAWETGERNMLSIGCSDGSGPMYVNAQAVQIVQLREVRA